MSIEIIFSTNRKMGNRTSRGFDYGTFVRLIEEGPSYLSIEPSIWSPSEKRCLKEFLSLLKDPRLPWVGSVQEAFTRVRLAVPKSKMAAEIHAYVEDPVNKDLEAFSSLHPKAQICWAHFYSLVLFMWTLHQGRPSSMIFHESDLLYYVFRNEEGVDYEKIDLFIHALERIQTVNPNQTQEILVKNRLLFGPFTLITGSIRNGSITIEADSRPRLIEPGVYLTEGPVTISGVEKIRDSNLSRIEKIVEKIRDLNLSQTDSDLSETELEKSGPHKHRLDSHESQPHEIQPRSHESQSHSHELQLHSHELQPHSSQLHLDESCSKGTSRHFLSRRLESDSETEMEDSPSHDHSRCGPSDTREYLDEILFRLDALCRFHKQLGFK